MTSLHVQRFTLQRSPAMTPLRHLLSTYLGHAMVTNTYWYLSGVLELVGLAGKRFEWRMAPGSQGSSHA